MATGFLTTLANARIVAERDFLVIGGYAVNAHRYLRFTHDLDLLIRRDQKDFWKKLALDYGYTLFCERENFLQLTPPSAVEIPVDFMLVNDHTFQTLYAEAIEGLIGGVAVKHPSLKHLIALKLHVVKQELPHRHLRDFYDVLELIRVNKLNVSTKDFQEFCEKHGNAKLYEAIVRGTK